jgi:tRNA(Ile)-lysidine synthase
MLSQFKAFIANKGLLKQSQRALLGVSGGIDSSVMADLFAKTNLSFALAHCNFKLRGPESDKDQLFVERLAKKYNVTYFTIEFDTESYSRKKGISIQMAARDLRYSWFNDIAHRNGFDRIAVAHNRDDVAETMLLNLIRGTGLKGLTGIKPIQDIVIRPLLFAGRNEIEGYAIKEKIVYREDLSNKETKYYRNLIRNKIIPLMQKINPSVQETLNQEAEIFTSAFALYKQEIRHIIEAVTIEEGERVVLSIPKMLSLRLNAPIVYELLLPYGFSYTDSQNILKSFQSESGKTFNSGNYILVKDRSTIIIKEQENPDHNTAFEIPEGVEDLHVPIRLSLQIKPRTSDFKIPTSAFSVALDADKIKFPLKLRKWANGDFFVPLGMHGKKKLSDFFIDRKISILDKEDIWLLISQDHILWVIGQQIDDRFKIMNETKNILLITLKN